MSSKPRHGLRVSRDRLRRIISDREILDHALSERRHSGSLSENEEQECVFRKMPHKRAQRKSILSSQSLQTDGKLPSSTRKENARPQTGRANNFPYREAV
jgi:hypothetical protein